MSKSSSAPRRRPGRPSNETYFQELAGPAPITRERVKILTDRLGTEKIQAFLEVSPDLEGNARLLKRLQEVAGLSRVKMAVLLTASLEGVDSMLQEEGAKEESGVKAGWAGSRAFCPAEPGTAPHIFEAMMKKPKSAPMNSNLPPRPVLPLKKNEKGHVLFTDKTWGVLEQ